MVNMIKGVIGIIDILGVKGIWARESPEDIIKKWNEILKSLNEDVEIMSKIIDKKDKIDRKIKEYSFSDTIILTIASDSLNSLLVMCGIIGDIFSVSMDKGILFRGAISFGNFYSHKTMLIGPAIDDAAEWYSKSDWAGVHLTPKTSYYIDYCLAEGVKKDQIKYLLIKYNVPLKEGRILQDIWTVSWPSIYLKCDEDGQKTSISDFRQKILKIYSRNPIGIEHEKKYRNTIDYFDFVTSDMD